MEMTFEHYYARSIEVLKVVYIEYQDGRPFSVICSKDGICRNFDFEIDCHSPDGLMFYHSGGGGSILEIRAPHYAGSGNVYWMHESASFEPGTEAININRIASPIEYTGNSNPFENSREIYQVNFCKHCDKYYDENYCSDHHSVDDMGALVYDDGEIVE